MSRHFGFRSAAVPWLGRSLLAVLCGCGLGLELTGCERQPLSEGLPDHPDCSSCHGSVVNAAPPRGVDGATSTDRIGVGAHQAHLLAGTVAAPVACTECHLLPTSLLDHPSFDGGPAQVVFGPLATAAGAIPIWDRNLAQCSNGYCHGGTLSGAETRPGPIWTRVDGSQLVCTACHGFPPGGSHPADSRCEACHGEVVGAGGVILVKERHIDGIVDVQGGARFHPEGYADPALHGADTNRGVSNCKACHGADLSGSGTTIGCDPCHQQGWRTNCVYCHGGIDNSTGAPPVDLLGGTATSALGVGSHTSHVSRTNHAAYACTVCHAAVTDVLSDGHLFDSTPGRAEVVLSGAPGGTGQYQAPGCSDVYCHGTGRANGSAPNFVPGAPLSCTSCHPAATQSSGHLWHTSFGCETCHAAVVSSSTQVLNPDLHVNGSVDVSMAAGVWDAAAQTCSDTACHGAGALPW